VEPDEFWEYLGGPPEEELLVSTRQGRGCT